MPKVPKEISDSLTGEPLPFYGVAQKAYKAAAGQDGTVWQGRRKLQRLWEGHREDLLAEWAYRLLLFEKGYGGRDLERLYLPVEVGRTARALEDCLKEELGGLLPPAPLERELSPRTFFSPAPGSPLRALTPCQRQIVYLIRVEGLQQKEIAGRLGRTPAWVRQELHKAEDRFRQEMKNE